MNGNQASSDFLKEDGVLPLSKRAIDKTIDGLIMKSKNIEGE